MSRRDPISKEERERLRKLEAEATPGPWFVTEYGGTAETGWRGVAALRNGGHTPIEDTDNAADLELAAASRVAIPAYEAALQQAEDAAQQYSEQAAAAFQDYTDAREEVERLRAQLEHIRDLPCIAQLSDEQIRAAREDGDETTCGPFYAACALSKEDS